MQNPVKGNSLTIRELVNTKGSDWHLEIVTGEEGLDRQVATFELNRPGLALAGYYDVFSVERIQIIGLTEASYLESLASDERRSRLRRMMEFNVPCMIITRSMEAIPELVDVMRELKIPLLRTPQLTSPFQADLGQYLERRLAPRWAVQGVMIEVFGMGVLLQGKSGVGKSECALELIQRGHLMIADDIVMMRRVSRGRLFAEAAPNLGYHMEIRGIGIIDVELLFGVRSVREESGLTLVIELEKWDSTKEYERLGLTERHITLFETQVPHIVLPVEPGRNLAQLIEVAALMQRLKSQGTNVPKAFESRMRAIIDSKRMPPGA